MSTVGSGDMLQKERSSDVIQDSDMFILLHLLRRSTTFSHNKRLQSHWLKYILILYDLWKTLYTVTFGLAHEQSGKSQQWFWLGVAGPDDSRNVGDWDMRLRWLFLVGSSEVNWEYNWCIKEVLKERILMIHFKMRMILITPGKYKSQKFEIHLSKGYKSTFGDYKTDFALIPSMLSCLPQDVTSYSHCFRNFMHKKQKHKIQDYISYRFTKWSWLN